MEMKMMTTECVTVSVGGQNVLAMPRDFKTGSRGFYGSDKVTFGGKRYQVSVNIVEIGSKPKTEEEKKKAKKPQ